MSQIQKSKSMFLLLFSFKHVKSYLRENAAHKAILVPLTRVLAHCNHDIVSTLSEVDCKASSGLHSASPHQAVQGTRENTDHILCYRSKYPELCGE